MKKFGILIIALALLIVGIAMAGTCPFDAPNETPQGFADSDGVMDAGYTLEIAGTCFGTMHMSESAVAQTTGGLESSKVNAFSLIGSNGATQFARTVEGSQNAYDNSIQTSTVVSYEKGTFGGGLIGSEGVYSTMCAFGVGDENSTAGFNPFCEKVASGVGFALSSGTFASDTRMSSAITPNLPNELSMIAAITGNQNTGKQLAQGSMSMFTSISTTEGVTRTITDAGGNVTGTESVPTSMSSYDSRMRMIGDFSNAFSFNYATTHGSGVPAGFPYTKVTPICC